MSNLDEHNRRREYVRIMCTHIQHMDESYFNIYPAAIGKICEIWHPDPAINGFVDDVSLTLASQYIETTYGDDDDTLEDRNAFISDHLRIFEDREGDFDRDLFDSYVTRLRELGIDPSTENL